MIEEETQFQPDVPSEPQPEPSPNEAAEGAQDTMGIEALPDDAADTPIEGLNELLEESEEDFSEDQAAAETAALITDLSQQNAALRTEIETLKAQAKEINEYRLRLAADFENFRKRTEREREELKQKITGDTILELLPVVDNFDRARSQIKLETEGEKAIHGSYQSIYRQLVDCLKRLGVAPMRPVGEVFDPNLHEAVMSEPTAEYPEGVVMNEMRRGYLLGERVLRHALVKVAASPPQPAQAEEAASE